MNSYHIPRSASLRCQMSLGRLWLSAGGQAFHSGLLQQEVEMKIF